MGRSLHDSSGTPEWAAVTRTVPAAMSVSPRTTRKPTPPPPAGSRPMSNGPAGRSGAWNFTTGTAETAAPWASATARQTRRRITTPGTMGLPGK